MYEYVCLLGRGKRSVLLTPWERQEMATKVSETLDSLFAPSSYDERLRYTFRRYKYTGSKHAKDVIRR
jgi:hypothetical protein